MARSGMQISIGVDGSASAESGSMVNELMQTWLVHRATGGPRATRVDDVLYWGTRGGAELLGLDTGRLEPGACADLVLYDLEDPRLLGVWEPYQAPVICGEPLTARRVMVNGRWVVEDGRVLGVDAHALAASARWELARLRRFL
jgi:cytosine/adenosine deaminase-related metal-dependent hydrolase